MNGNPQRSLSEFAISRRKLLVELGALAAVAGVGGRLFIPVARAQSAGGVFVGKIDGTNAFVGIVTDGQQAEAYVCNGVQFKELFTGTMAGDSNGRVTLLGEDGDLLPIDVNSNSLQDLLASGGSLTGALAIGGVSNAFRADPAMGPGAVYLSIGTLPDGSTMDGGTIVLNNGDFRGILDTIIGALGDAADAAATFLESGATPDEPGTIGLGEVLAAGVSALTGDTQGALNILNGCASGNEDPVLCPTANVNSVPLFTVSMTGGASGGGTPLGSTPASSAPGGGDVPARRP